MPEVYKEFREQLIRNPEKGWYETGLPWKAVCDAYTLLKLCRIGKLGEYDAIIRDQLAEGVIAPAPPQAIGKEFYMPHRAVIRETAETTKMRVVYDCSARGAKDVPPLNDYLEPGPAL